MTPLQSIVINGPSGKIQAMVELPDVSTEKILAIICHPHPLQGGTMNNKVVTTLVRTCQKLGCIAIRFNYRGVGESEGEFGHVTGELEDLRAVVAYAQQEYPDYTLWLAGFSFGSYIAAKVATEIPIKQLISIAPPVENMDFAELPRITCPWVIVQGDADEVVAAQRVYDWLATRTEAYELIRMPGVGHFFHGKLIELRDALVETIKRQQQNCIQQEC